MKIVFIGGHLSPALAVIQNLSKNDKILYIGRKHALEGDKALSLEFQTINSLEIPFANLSTSRLQRKLTRHTIISLFKFPVGIIKAFKILYDFKPDAVIGFGGYVQLPVIFAAYLQKIPVIIHEQTLGAGLANRLTAPFAQKICISWEASSSFFPKNKTILTGLPLRKEFLQKPQKIINLKSSFKKIYITGGSQGAHTLNILCEGALEKLLTKFVIYHQTGGATEYQDYERLTKIRSTLPSSLQDRYTITRFVVPEKVRSIMESADFVISRSGINTVAELLYLNKPSILIPLPYGQHNEQKKNALFLEGLGIAICLEQSNLTPDNFYSQISEFAAKLDNIKEKTQKFKKLINNDTPPQIINLIRQIAPQKKSA